MHVGAIMKKRRTQSKLNRGIGMATMKKERAKREIAMTETWQLISGKLQNGNELLTLKRGDKVLCLYAPAVGAFKGRWHSYYNGFPLAEFSSREACIRDAERIANQSLEVII